ncbi:hypothetical protein NOM68_12900, partial [Proteus mirabilis]|uniref:hypothetical protein n=1 Tax=Proteus mirabilis TaxID=584 RepID=UPI00217EC41E
SNWVIFYHIALFFCEVFVTLFFPIYFRGFLDPPYIFIFFGNFILSKKVVLTFLVFFYVKYVNYYYLSFALLV